MVVSMSSKGLMLKKKCYRGPNLLGTFLHNKVKEWIRGTATVEIPKEYWYLFS